MVKIFIWVGSVRVCHSTDIEVGGGVASKSEG